MNVPPSLSQARREHPRIAAGFEVRLNVGSKLVNARARDLSMAGLYVEGKVQLPDQVAMTIPLPGLKKAVVTTARVERRDAHGTALSFADIDWDDLLLMARYLAPRL